MLFGDYHEVTAAYLRCLGLIGKGRGDVPPGLCHQVYPKVRGVEIRSANTGACDFKPLCSQTVALWQSKIHGGRAVLYEL
jgi:hypothetical protein